MDKYLQKEDDLFNSSSSTNREQSLLSLSNGEEKEEEGYSEEVMDRDPILLDSIPASTNSALPSISMDLWSGMAFIIKMMASLAVDTFATGALTDLTLEICGATLKKIPSMGVSVPGLAFGGTTAILMNLGASVCEMKLNQSNQEEVVQLKWRQFANRGVEISTSSFVQSHKDIFFNLSLPLKASLVAGMAADTLDTAGGIIILLNGGLNQISQNPLLWAKGISMVSFFLLGVLGSLAKGRTYLMAMEEMKMLEEGRPLPSASSNVTSMKLSVDFLSGMALIIKSVTSIIVDTPAIGELLDVFLRICTVQVAKISFLQVSMAGLVAGGCSAILINVGASISEMKVNQSNQEEVVAQRRQAYLEDRTLEGDLPPPNESEVSYTKLFFKLSPWLRFSIVAVMLAEGLDISGGPIILINQIVTNPWILLAVMISFIALGTLGSIAKGRTNLTVTHQMKELEARTFPDEPSSSSCSSFSPGFCAS